MPEYLIGLKAELQIRTIARHAWSDIGHDRIYKAECDIPDYWKREANRIAALLEAADDAFERLVQGISAFQTYSKHVTDATSAREQILLLEVVRKKLPEDSRPALKAARLALDLGDWESVLTIANAYTEPIGKVGCEEWLGGLLRHYYRQAA